MQNINLKLRNLFGNGESVTARSSYGFDTSTSLSKRDLRGTESVKEVGMQGASANEIVFSKPLWGIPDVSLQGSLYQLERNHSASMSYQERLRGLSCKVSPQTTLIKGEINPGN